MKKISAFSLSEVLIAMAVIGIVAGLVIPNQISGARTKAYKTLYKSTFEQIQQGLTTAANVNKHPFVKVSNSVTLPNEAEFTLDRFMEHHYNAKEVTRNAPKDSLTEANVGKTYLMKNGAQVIFDEGSLTIMDATGCTNAHPCDAFIDVNGDKGPNSIVVCTEGTVDTDLSNTCAVTSDAIRDIFPVVIKMGHIYPKTNAADYVLNN